MSSATELPPAVQEENADKTLKTILSPKQSVKNDQNLENDEAKSPSNKSVAGIEDVEAKIRTSVKNDPGGEIVEGKKTPSPSIKSGQGTETAEAKKTPSPSIKSGQGAETAEAKKTPSPSIKSGQGAETAEAKKTPSPSIKSGQGAETAEAKKTPSPSIKSGQGAETAEAKKTPSPSIKSGQEAETAEAKKTLSPSIKSGQGVENEAKKSLTPSVADKVPAQEEQEKPTADVPEKKIEEIANQQEVIKEVAESTQIPQPPKGTDVKRKSVSDGKPFRSNAAGGLRSNKDVKQPSADEDPVLPVRVVRPAGALSGSQPPWLYAVGGLMALTIIMRFFMNNLRFVGVVLYAAVISCLALRYYGSGPFADRRRRR